MKKLEQKLSSREVANMMEVEHKNLLKKIDGINKDLLSSKVSSVKYWEEGTYKDESGKSNREFQITKRGCEFLAHKTTGAKGNLFTDKYMDKFSYMEEELTKKKTPSYILDDPIERARAWIMEQEEKKDLLLTTQKQQQVIGELKPKADYTDSILKNKGLVTITQIAKDYGMSGQEMNKLLHDLKVQYKQSKQWLLYSDIQGKGYTHSQTVSITRTDGRADIQMNTKWTQKGRLFLYDLLKQHDVLPSIEIEESEAI